jgi:hypothetical protein
VVRDSTLPTLSADEYELLLEALDSHEYWQLGEALPRNDGMVWVPGDCVDPIDPYWQAGEPSTSQAEAIEAVEACRRLAAKLRAAVTPQAPTGE